MRSLKTLPLLALGLLMAALPVEPALAFCGFYVAKADGDLFNDASKVVMVRDGDRTVITMASDYRGEASEFAMVVPVPTVLQEGQIHVTETAIVDHLDAYSAPRLVEFFDPDPCRVMEFEDRMFSAAPSVDFSAGLSNERARTLGVTIEAEYTVGEYNILILSAEESDGLQIWLTENGYQVPAEALPVLADYIASGMKFFVAEVNLEERERIGARFLRPLQIAFESPDFMLPIRLGMVNASGPQDMFVFTLTRTGRVETANYETVRMPSALDVPIFVREEFDDFYTTMFERQWADRDYHAVFVEYAWDMAWCDPCAADPLSQAELRDLGVFWLDERNGRNGGAQDVFLTRLHIRYDAEHFPTDLMFEETGERENFQGRYILRHPWNGAAVCDAAKSYLGGLRARFGHEAQTLADLTGWNLDGIIERMATNGQPLDIHLIGNPNGNPPNGSNPWWQRLWPNR